MGRLFIQYLDGRLYACKACGCHLASQRELLSKVGRSLLSGSPRRSAGASCAMKCAGVW